MQLVEAYFQVVSLDLPWHLFLAVRNTSVENLRSTELSGLFHTTLIFHVFIYSYSSLLYKLKATSVSEVRQTSGFCVPFLPCVYYSASHKDAY